MGGGGYVISQVGAGKKKGLKFKAVVLDGLEGYSRGEQQSVRDFPNLKNKKKAYLEVGG